MLLLLPLPSPPPPPPPPQPPPPPPPPPLASFTITFAATATPALPFYHGIVLHVVIVRSDVHAVTSEASVAPCHPDPTARDGEVPEQRTAGTVVTALAVSGLVRGRGSGRACSQTRGRPHRSRLEQQRPVPGQGDGCTQCSILSLS